MIDEKKLIEMLRYDISCFETDGMKDEEMYIRVDDMMRMIEGQPKVGEWIPVTERLPTREEYLKDDGRFMLDDGNRRYQGLFDIYDRKFKFSMHIRGLYYELIEDKRVIAWMPLPEPYKLENERKGDFYD